MRRSRCNAAACAILAPSLAIVFLTIVFLGMNLVPVRAQGPVPDLNGVWARDAHSYPKPYRTNGVITDGYDNEYLKPWVVELLERDALVTRSSRTVVTPHSICYPEGVPYVFGATQIQILQTPTEITMLFPDTGHSRTIYLNVPHSEPVVPSWWGDSVGHFEGDTLVVDTVGNAVNPQAGSMGGAGAMGGFGTPHTIALHVVERWRFLRPGENSTAPPPRNDSFDADAVIEGGNIMRLTFTADDPRAYRKPWSVTLDYLPLSSRAREFDCPENTRFWDLAPLLPTAVVPDY